MTVRSHAKCTICDYTILLKIGEGSEPYQPHIFDCPNCFSPITIALRKIEDLGHSFECVVNCSYPSEAEISSLDLLPNDKVNPSIICLHSNFAFDINSIHDPMGTMHVKLENSIKLLKHAKKRWSFLNDIKTRKKHNGPVILDIAHYFDVPDCEKIWNTILKPYYIAINQNNLKNIESLKNKYIKERKKYVPQVNVITHEDLYFDYFNSMFYPRFGEIYQIINQAIIKAKQTNFSEFTRLINYYKTERWDDSQEQLIQLFSEYYTYTTEYAQMRYYARVSENNVENLIVGSKNFDKTKLFYGNAYEVITNEYIFLAGIFNILGGRPFDQFKSMNLHQYIKDCSKDSRKAPLQTYTPFMDFLDEIDSTLRNGTHHASIRRSGEILYYRSGGTGAEREIEYSKYLYLCNRLMILCTAIFCIEHKWLNKTF